MENKSELSFTWESTEEFSGKVDQTIRLFSIVTVSLVKNENDRLKYNVILKHPHDVKDRIKSDKADVEDKNGDNKFYDQQFDTDPYLLD